MQLYTVLLVACLPSIALARTVHFVTTSTSNDLVSLLANEPTTNVLPTYEAALNAAIPGDAVVLLADQYPSHKTPVPDFSSIPTGVKIFAEFPQLNQPLLPAETDTVTDSPLDWKYRGVLMSDFSILQSQDPTAIAFCDANSTKNSDTFCAAACDASVMQFAIVAGYDTAPFGVDGCYPAIFYLPNTNNNVIIATSSFSNFI